MRHGTQQILVTGGNGFLGRALCARLTSDGYLVRASVRKEQVQILDNIDVVQGELVPKFDWSPALRGVDTVLHTAARVHVMHDRANNSLDEFLITNTCSTLNLARQAALAGVRRLIFISSIGVNGTETFNLPFSHNTEPAPYSPYAISKYEAELKLQGLTPETDMEVVIIRPPMIYGPNAPGNFGSLIRWLDRGLPLPLGAVTQNRRSLVGLDNLVDLIITCINHPKAANQTFLASDGEDISTADLVKKICRGMNCENRLVPIPMNLLVFASRLLGNRRAAQSLLGSLQVDISKTCDLLDWKPPVSLDEGLRRAVQKIL